MIRKIENEKLCVQISDIGAEPVSVYDKENSREVLWQADPAYWKRHAPVLFPNVGKHYHMQYRVGGKSYPSGQHGFARDMEFTCTKESADTIVHVLKSTEKTLEVYPFAFTLEITHSINSGELTITWKVINENQGNMYFTIGGHPAFNVPVIEGTTYDQYSLYFPGKDMLSYLLIAEDGSGTLLTDLVYSMQLTDGVYPIDLHTFDKDALVFDGNQIERVGILLPDGKPYLEMKAEGFPNFGIWAAPGAPFVCLEPWMGRCDDYGYEGDLTEKPNINVLAEGGVFCKSYTITIF